MDLEHLGYRLPRDGCGEISVLLAGLDVNARVWDWSRGSVRAEGTLGNRKRFSLVKVRCHGLVGDHREVIRTRLNHSRIRFSGFVACHLHQRVLLGGKLNRLVERDRPCLRLRMRREQKKKEWRDDCCVPYTLVMGDDEQNRSRHKSKHHRPDQTKGDDTGHRRPHTGS